MKSIQEILSGFGVSIPEDKADEFTKEFTANYKSTAEVAKIEAKRDNYKEQLDAAQSALKGFEGVDVGELKGKIEALTSDLQKKDGEYKTKLVEMEFASALDTAISATGARNAKAVKALLDLDALKSSKNQSEDIKAALSAVKADNDFLFTSDEPIKNPVAPTTAGVTSERMTLAEAMEYKNTHPEADISTLIKNS